MCNVYKYLPNISQPEKVYTYIQKTNKFTSL